MAILIAVPISQTKPWERARPIENFYAGYRYQWLTAPSGMIRNSLIPALRGGYQYACLAATLIWVQALSPGAAACQPGFSPTVLLAARPPLQ
jgi:hypothetical protein